MRILIPFVILVVIGLIVGSQTLYMLDQTEQAVITRLGVVQKIVTNPGLHAKTPFVESVNRLEKRLLRFDATPSEFLTGEKKALVINSYARYRILDPQQFFEVVRTEVQARARLEAIISSEIRAEVATHDQIAVIRDRREELMLDVTKRSDIQAREFGIAVVDVRIVGADFPPEVATSVFARMQSERVRIANRFRAEGEEQRDTVEAAANLESRTILASAEEKAATIRGEGEAEAIQILGDAIDLDLDFFTFVRTLEAYIEALDSGTTLVIPADSDFYQFITDPYPVGSAQREDG
jgi:membrane protease subunit HflC